MYVRDIYVGDYVTFVDSKGYPLNGLITAVFGWNSVEKRNAYYKEVHENTNDSWATVEWYEGAINSPYVTPSVNVVYVSNDETQKDSYGRQIGRATSVPHQSSQSANGYYWK